MIKKMCDKCGSAMELSSSMNMINSTYTINRYSWSPLSICAIDLCPKCERLLDKWLKEKPESEEA